jgi:hypothetical protein
MFLLLLLSVHEMNLLPPHCFASGLVKRRDTGTQRKEGVCAEMRNSYLFQSESK